MLSCSIRAHIHCPSVSGGLEALDQLQQRARNSVFFGVVVKLDCEGSEFPIMKRLAELSLLPRIDAIAAIKPLSGPRDGSLSATNVASDGSRQLITRGTYTADNGALPIGEQDLTIPTYGNLWRLPADHTLRIELTNLDTPYITPSRVPSATTVSNVNVEIPIR